MGSDQSCEDDRPQGHHTGQIVSLERPEKLARILIEAQSTLAPLLEIAVGEQLGVTMFLFSIALIWIATTFGFVGVLAYQIAHNGYFWIYQTPTGLCVIGIVAIYSLLTIIGIVLNGTPKSTEITRMNETQSRYHDEMMTCIRTLYVELATDVGTIETAVGVIDSQLRKLRS